MMKAFLLAGGLGERLRPLTDDFPKCLMPVAGRPLLSYWVTLFERYGITEVLINLHHLPDPVVEYLRSLGNRRVRFRIFREDRLLGSAGTIAANADFIRGEKDYYILYADNLTNVNLESLARFHREHHGILSMGLFRTPAPWQCGIVELDSHGLVTSFQEKPAHPLSNLANAGVFMASADLLAHIPQVSVADLGQHVLPKLIGHMYGYEMREYLQDIGTMENYLSALRWWRGFSASSAEGPRQRIGRRGRP